MKRHTLRFMLIGLLLLGMAALLHTLPDPIEDDRASEMSRAQEARRAPPILLLSRVEQLTIFNDTKNLSDEALLEYDIKHGLGFLITENSVGRMVTLVDINSLIRNLEKKSTDPSNESEQGVTLAHLKELERRRSELASHYRTRIIELVKPEK